MENKTTRDDENAVQELRKCLFDIPDARSDAIRISLMKRCFEHLSKVELEIEETTSMSVNISDLMDCIENAMNQSIDKSIDSYRLSSSSYDAGVMYGAEAIQQIVLRYFDEWCEVHSHNESSERSDTP